MGREPHSVSDAKPRDAKPVKGRQTQLTRGMNTNRNIEENREKPSHLPRNNSGIPDQGSSKYNIGACNVIVARVHRATDSGIECGVDGLATLVAPPAQDGDHFGEGGRIALALRPEAISIRPDDQGRMPERNGTALEVRDVAFTGATLKIQGVSPGGNMLDIELGRSAMDGRQPPEPGEKVVAEWREQDLTVLRRPGRNGDS